MTSMKSSKYGDVRWFVPRLDGKQRKRPDGYTTTATSDLIAILAELCPTWNDVFHAIRYDLDAKVVALAFCRAGWAETSPLEHVWGFHDQRRMYAFRFQWPGKAETLLEAEGLWERPSRSRKARS